MKHADDNALLRLLWSVAEWPLGCYRSTDGREVRVVDGGEVLPERSVAVGARIEIYGCLCSGTILGAVYNAAGVAVGEQT